MYLEIGRIFSLGVLEHSQSACSFPMRMVENQTKFVYVLTHANYPLQSIECIFDHEPFLQFQVEHYISFWVMTLFFCNAPSTMSHLMDDLILPDLRHCDFGYITFRYLSSHS